MQKEFLLLALFTCHWLADYTWLSRPFMLKAKSSGTPLWPIFLHAFIHAFLMGIVLLFFIDSPDNSMVWTKLFLLQLVSHFIIDVWKGRMNVWFYSLRDTSKYPHWIIFGLDQLLHSTVIIFIAYFATLK